MGPPKPRPEKAVLPRAVPIYHQVAWSLGRILSPARFGTLYLHPADRDALLRNKEVQIQIIVDRGDELGPIEAVQLFGVTWRLVPNPFLPIGRPVIRIDCPER